MFQACQRKGFHGTQRCRRIIPHYGTKAEFCPRRTRNETIKSGCHFSLRAPRQFGRLHIGQQWPRRANGDAAFARDAETLRPTEAQAQHALTTRKRAQGRCRCCAFAGGKLRCQTHRPFNFNGAFGAEFGNNLTCRQFDIVHQHGQPRGISGGQEARQGRFHHRLIAHNHGSARGTDARTFPSYRHQAQFAGKIRNFQRDHRAAIRTHTHRA